MSSPLKQGTNLDLDRAIEHGNADEVYTILVKQRGLFAKAFYGERRTRHETVTLSKLWRRARDLVAKPLKPKAETIESALEEEQNMGLLAPEEGRA